MEFTTPFITSGGDAAEYRGGMQAEHPQVRYHNKRRGFLSCEITPALWQADFMTVDRVSRPGGVVSRSARMVVETGVAITQAV